MTPIVHEPGSGRVVLGAAAASFATGPTLVLLYAVREALADPAALDADDPGVLGSIIVYSSVFCLIGSIPAATVNAIALSRLVRRQRDALWWAIGSGGIVGMLVALIMGGLAGVPTDLRFAPWFTVTGGLMGLLHWLIAVRPRRRWRLWLQHDQEAIRAME